MQLIIPHEPPSVLESSAFADICGCCSNQDNPLWPEPEFHGHDTFFRNTSPALFHGGSAFCAAICSKRSAEPPQVHTKYQWHTAFFHVVLLWQDTCFPALRRLVPPPFYLLRCLEI